MGSSSSPQRECTDASYDGQGRIIPRSVGGVSGPWSAVVLGQAGLSLGPLVLYSGTGCSGQSGVISRLPAVVQWSSQVAIAVVAVDGGSLSLVCAQVCFSPAAIGGRRGCAHSGFSHRQVVLRLQGACTLAPFVPWAASLVHLHSPRLLDTVCLSGGNAGFFAP